MSVRSGGTGADPPGERESRSSRVRHHERESGLARAPQVAALGVLSLTDRHTTLAPIRPLAGSEMKTFDDGDRVAWDALFKAHKATVVCSSSEAHVGGGRGADGRVVTDRATF